MELALLARKKNRKQWVVGGNGNAKPRRLYLLLPTRQQLGLRAEPNNPQPTAHPLSTLRFALWLWLWQPASGFGFRLSAFGFVRCPLPLLVRLRLVFMRFEL